MHRVAHPWRRSAAADRSQLEALSLTSRRPRSTQTALQPLGPPLPVQEAMPSVLLTFLTLSAGAPDARPTSPGLGRVNSAAANSDSKVQPPRLVTSSTTASD